MSVTLAFPVAARPRARSGWLRRWRARQRTRAELRRLLAVSPHLLTDIGLSPAAAAAESAKPVWRA